MKQIPTIIHITNKLTTISTGNDCVFKPTLRLFLK